MIKLTTADNEHVWVNKEQVVLVAQAKTKQGEQLIPILGVSIVQMVGSPIPVVVRGSPDEIVAKLEAGNGGGSIFAA